MPKYMSADELAALIKANGPAHTTQTTPTSAPPNVVVVDVRDDDFVGGNIPNALNVPSRQLLASDGHALDELIEKTKGAKVVVFHCALSQVRGPKSARFYEERRNELGQGKAGSDVAQPEVAILSQGFSSFQEKFKDDPELVEKWDKNVWENFDWN